jgi:hypothetical protein
VSCRLATEPSSFGSVRRTGQSPTLAVSFLQLDALKQKKQRREIFVKAARGVVFELSS